VLDESADEEELIQRLLKIGVNVVSPRQIGLKGEKKDERYLIIAAQNGWVLLTKNAVDFRKLHETCLGLTQLMSFCVGADDSLPENILYKGLKLPLRAA